MNRITAAGRHFLMEWRVFRGLTQAAVARFCGVTQSTTSRIETGRLEYTQRYLEKLAELYGTTPAALLSINPLPGPDDRPRRRRNTTAIIAVCSLLAQAILARLILWHVI
jgi:transcriptional regulator with XRE-family HTH domain